MLGDSYRHNNPNSSSHILKHFDVFAASVGYVFPPIIITNNPFLLGKINILDS